MVGNYCVLCSLHTSSCPFCRDVPKVIFTCIHVYITLQYVENTLKLHHDTLHVRIYGYISHIPTLLQVDTFEEEGADVGPLALLHLSITPTPGGSRPGWWVDSIVVRTMMEGGDGTWGVEGVAYFWGNR